MIPHTLRFALVPSLVAAALMLAGCGSTKMLIIESTPTGADILLNGNNIGTTPLNHEVSFGDQPEHTVQIKKEHYLPFDTKVTDDDQEKQTINAELKRITALTLASSPTAQVLLNGEAIGTSPLTHEVHFDKSDSVELQLKAKGYETYSHTLSSSGPTAVDLNITLVPLVHTEFILVESDPSGASISFNDEYLCDTPCEIELDDKEQTLSRRLRIERRGFETKLLPLQYRGEDWQDDNFADKIKVIMQTDVGREGFSDQRGMQPLIVAPVIHQGTPNGQTATGGEVVQPQVNRARVDRSAPTPVNLPETPAALPATPEALPETPAALPATPEALPETPATLPATPETLPTTPESLIPKSAPAGSADPGLSLKDLAR